MRLLAPPVRHCIECLEARTLLSTLTIAQENQLHGTPQDVWDVGNGDPSVQGYATDISVNLGQTISFKINDPTLVAYHLDIYRLGYYGGDGARKVATIPASQTFRQNQPSPLVDTTTGLIDAGNWQVSASWGVPTSATSGIYIANIIREDTGSGSQMVFVVRDDDSHSDVLFQTSDSTWQAYNSWGGNSFYTGSPAGRAYKISYNRPFNTRTSTSNGRDFVFGEEYPMVRWLEANGYEVSYFTDMDGDRRGAEIKEHKIFMSTGHDEYWSGGQRANVEAARDAGVNLAFFSGNEVYWKTRWENSIDGTGTPYRTLVCYKESLAGGKIDPSPTWTGLWRDPRFVLPSEGTRPENALTGTIFTVNRGPGGETGTSFNVPFQYSHLRFWRDTAVASLQSGQTATLGDQVLGYEWDEDLDNGARPAGLVDLSSTTQTVPQKLLDYGVSVGTGVATHSLTLYRAASGALVFGAGTVQWSWGLDGIHDGAHTTPDTSMRQATVNLFADMGVQPATLQAGLKRASMSTDATAPTSLITNLTPNQQVTAGTTVNITGTASDAAGGLLAAVEISVDGGATWHRATGTTSWTYTWIPVASGPALILTRAVDDSINLEVPSSGVTVAVKSATTSTTGLVAAYGFNEGSGSTVTDSSGRGNNGTISGATWVNGLSGKALSFNGTSNWVTVADSNSLDLTSGMTLEAWVKPSALNDFSTVIMKERTGDLVYSLYAADGQGNPPSSYMSGTRSVVGLSPLTLNSWSHLAVTYDDSNLVLYVNGVLIATQNLPGGITTSTGALRIGGNSIWGEFFNGLVDEVRVYSRPLTQAEILADLSTPIGGSVDAVAPTASITSPAAGANVSGIVNVAINASDNLVVAGVQFLLNGQAYGAEDVAVPYSIPWDTRTLPNGAAVLSARVRDAAGNFATSAPLTVTVSNSPDTIAPSVSLTFPTTNLRVSGTTMATAFASDNLVVSGVLLRLNGAIVGVEDTTAPYRIAWNTTGFADGTYTLIAEARDASGNIGVSSPISVVIDNTKPSVVARSPAPQQDHVNANANLTVTFDEPVVPSTATFQVRDPANNLVPGAVSYEDSTNTLKFDPTQDLGLGVNYTITLAGVVDLAGNSMNGPLTWSFTTSSQVVNASLWESSVTPSITSTADPDPIEIGVKFRSDINGYVTGLRFYKGSANTGTHIAHLWDSSGNLLASGTFVNETASGWQQLNFTTPVSITSNTTYVASYYAPNGNYASDIDYFASAYDNGRLHALASGASGGNGVYRYVTGGGYPNSSFRSTNYWIDVVFSNVLTDVTPPTVTGQSPAAGASGVSPSGSITATLSESIVPSTVSFTLRDPQNNVISSTVSYNDAAHTLTLTPSATLAELTSYTVTLSGAQDLAGNTMSSPANWSFTTSGPDLVVPTIVQRSPGPNATAVAPSATVRAKFSESVQFSTISFILKDSADHTVEALLTYDDTTHTATLSPGGEDDGGLPEESLSPSTTYTATLSGAKDLAGNTMQTVTWSFTTDVTIANVSLWNSSVTPAVQSVNDGAAVEVGVKVQSTKEGYITGLRFFKGAGNTGTHLAHLWDAAGSLLATGTFSNETASGWQQANFAAPIFITTNTTYVASYYAPNGHYSANAGYFQNTGFTNAPLQALSNSASGGNGVYHYGVGGAFPTSSFGATNYWVDVVFGNTLQIDNTPPLVTSRTPAAGATNVPISTTVSAIFNEDIDPASLSFVLTDPSNNVISGVVSYDASTFRGTLSPTSALNLATTYSVTVSASDRFGNAMTPITWSFTTLAVVTNATIWPSSTVPAIPSVNDSAAVELGVKFRANTSGYITGLRFYKGTGNTGTHAGHLWTSAGTLLASATFAGESGSGWQQVDFPSPIAITANTTYVASYYAPLGHYSANSAYFASGATTNGALTAVANGGPDGGNGVYRYGAGGGFPTQSYNSTNYWVDVVYSNVLPNDTTPPTVVARSPAPGATGVAGSANVTASFSEPVQANTISFVLRDAANATVAAAVAYDATTRTVTLNPNATLVANAVYTATLSGATDNAGNVMATVSWSFTVSPGVTNLTIWSPSDTPAVAAENDGAAIEVGVKFRTLEDGYVSGVRFYKGAGNTGTHLGHLWASNGTLLATVTFSGESASGWQQANFTSPVFVTEGATYIVSYYAPVGHYSSSGGYFASSGTTHGQLTALANGVDGGNGVFRYGTGGGFPNQSYNATNYWVDVVYSSTPVDLTAPTVTARNPAPGATGVPTNSNVTAVFSEAVQPQTISMTLRDVNNNVVPAQVSYDATSRTVTLDPNADLTQGAWYSVTLSGAADAAGNVMTTLTWSFTVQAPIVGATIWNPDTTPSVISANDSAALELGMKFRSSLNGYITGVRFYKGTGNTGTHTGHLWASDGTLLGTVTFGNETSTGWQQADFTVPIAIVANQTYVISYFAPAGHYALDSGYFSSGGTTNGPLTALANGADGGNGVFRYSATGGFPNQSAGASNYWVDVVFSETNAPGGLNAGPNLLKGIPAAASRDVSTRTRISATFDQIIVAEAADFTVQFGKQVVPGGVKYNDATRTLTLTPAVALAPFTTYTVMLREITSFTGARMSPASWTFTTGAPLASGQGSAITRGASATALQPMMTTTAKLLSLSGAQLTPTPRFSAATPAAKTALGSAALEHLGSAMFLESDVLAFVL
jgi:methionine-rich copper-binding protein CopC